MFIAARKYGEPGDAAKILYAPGYTFSNFRLPASSIAPGVCPWEPAMATGLKYTLTFDGSLSKPENDTLPRNENGDLNISSTLSKSTSPTHTPAAAFRRIPFLS